MRSLTLCLILLGCSNGNANHIGNPITLPISAITTGLENVSYNTRRNRVKANVIKNRKQLKKDVIAGNGPALNQIFEIAKIPAQKQAPLLKELQRGIETYFNTNIEPLVVTIMVHS